jgi:hypothetical protein
MILIFSIWCFLIALVLFLLYRYKNVNVLQNVLGSIFKTNTGQILVYRNANHTIVKIPGVDWHILNANNKLYIYLKDYFLDGKHQCLDNYSMAVELGKNVDKASVVILPLVCIPNLHFFENYHSTPTLIPLDKGLLNDKYITILDIINVLGKKYNVFKL